MVKAVRYPRTVHSPSENHTRSRESRRATPAEASIDAFTTICAPQDRVSHALNHRQHEFDQGKQYLAAAASLAIFAARQQRMRLRVAITIAGSSYSS
jgi:hypothetical protein